MPILNLQRRHTELGRIRLGRKGEKGQPQKLDRFRFTSPSPDYIAAIADLYGGTPRPWDNNGKPEHEVITDASSVPVIAIRGGLTQWMETWSGGGCIHRCDGYHNVLTDTDCDPEDPAHRSAKPTTRLAMMLRDLDAFGAWRMESHGFNAAAEIPAVAELAQFVGDLVPAVLLLQERRSVRDGKTSRFVVPVLDLQIGTAKLREVVAAKMEGAPELAAPGRPAAAALEAPKAAAESGDSQRTSAKIPTPEQIAGFDLETARKALAYLQKHAPAHPATDAVYDRVADLEPSPDAEGAIDAEIVDPTEPATTPAGSQQVPAPGDADMVWQQILAKAGEGGMTLLADVEDHFASRMGGLSSAEASAAELQAYLGILAEGVPA